jgi:phosphomannomutase / phosphoglucomutase
LAELYKALPKTSGAPTMSPHCDDEKKYGVADKVTERLKAMQAKGELFTRQKKFAISSPSMACASTLFPDGTWGLVRASSNKPELVVVAESPASEARMRETVDAILRENKEVGGYNQTI